MCPTYSRSSYCILDFRFGQNPVADARVQILRIDQIETPAAEQLRQLRLDSMQPDETRTVTVLELDIDICIKNAIIGAEETQHLCPDRRVALIYWRIDAGEHWRC
jgi:hypothetical protein